MPSSQWPKDAGALGKDSQAPREVEPPDRGEIVAIPEAGGLHHRYTRRAA
jgi:hypothetical protein